mgnify:FL=1
MCSILFHAHFDFQSVFCGTRTGELLVFESLVSGHVVLFSRMVFLKDL